GAAIRAAATKQLEAAGAVALRAVAEEVRPPEVGAASRDAGVARSLPEAHRAPLVARGAAARGEEHALVDAGPRGPALAGAIVEREGAGVVAAEAPAAPLQEAAEVVAAIHVGRLTGAPVERRGADFVAGEAAQ